MKVLVFAKPDAVRRRLLGDIIKSYEQESWQVVRCKLLQPLRESVQGHYQEHSGKPFYDGLVDFTCGGNILLMVMEKKRLSSGRCSHHCHENSRQWCTRGRTQTRKPGALLRLGKFGNQRGGVVVWVLIFGEYDKRKKLDFSFYVRNGEFLRPENFPWTMMGSVPNEPNQRHCNCLRCDRGCHSHSCRYRVVVLEKIMRTVLSHQPSSEKAVDRPCVLDEGVHYF